MATKKVFNQAKEKKPTSAGGKVMISENSATLGGNNKISEKSMAPSLQMGTTPTLGSKNTINQKLVATIPSQNLAADLAVNKGTTLQAAGTAGSAATATGSSLYTRNPLPNYGAYQDPESVTAAKAAMDKLMAERPSTVLDGKYGEQIQGILDQINGRQPFKYDLNADMLYQQYKDKYLSQGRMAMQDAMGQASALTGGYGNSYAAAVGNQAYQNSIQQLNNVVPDLYKLALDQYNSEGDELYRRYGLATDQYDRAMQEMQYANENWRKDLDYATNQYWNQNNDAYGKWTDQRSYDTDSYWKQTDFDYNSAINQRDFDYQKGIDERNFNYQKDIDQRNFDYQKAQDALAYQMSADQFAQSLALDQAKLQFQIDQATGALKSAGTSGSSGGKSSGSGKGTGGGGGDDGKPSAPTTSTKNANKVAEQYALEYLEKQVKEGNLTKKEADKLKKELDITSGKTATKSTDLKKIVKKDAKTTAKIFGLK